MGLPLSKRQREILERVAQGESSRDIGARLDMSVSTVRNHMRSVMDRLGARNRAHAVILALQSGQITVDGKQD